MMYIPNHDVRIYHTGTTQNNRGCLSRGVHAVLPRRRFEREWVCVVRRADSTSAVRRGAARRGGTVAWPARAERRPPRIFYAYSVLYIQRPVINFYIFNFWHILFHLFFFLLRKRKQYLKTCSQIQRYFIIQRFALQQDVYSLDKTVQGVFVVTNISCSE